MAEYKGLTIRIGGDTSSLNSALKASTKAASSLQSQIRQITRAMRFDPGSMGNVNTRMKLTTNRAEALYSKIRLLKSGYDELAASTVRVGGRATSVKKLADTTENISLAATAAKERYNDMTATLASRYRELESRAKAAGKAMNLNALSRQGSDETFETQMAALKELGAVTDQEIQKLREMRATWNEAFDSSEAYKAAETMQSMSVNMQRFESEARNATATVRELNGVSKYSEGNWQESTAKIKAMDSALSECSKQAKAYEAALRKDPSNLSAAVGRLKALNDEYDIAQNKVKELSRQVEAYRSKLSGTLAEEKNLPAYIQKTGDEWQKVQGELAEAKGDANALRQSLQRLKDAQAPVEEIRQLEAAVGEADAKVDALNASARRMDAEFETAKECAELERLQGELSETTAHVASLKKRMSMKSLGGKDSMLNASTIKSAGMTLYSTLTPAVTMLGWRTVTAAQDMDSAFRDMAKTVDASDAQLQELKQGAIEFSKTHVTSAEQMLQIEAIGGELGIATENLQQFAETVSNLDVATNLDTEEAASSLGKLANITHMGADEYSRYGDALVRLGNNGASTEDQIVDIATRIGSMGTIVGLTVPEILALSSSIASTGMKTEASGTAIANTLSDMESAVANGGDKLEAFADAAGMTADQFAQKWQEEPIVVLEEFVKHLNDIEKDGGSADATLEGLGITGTRQKQAIEGLMQTIGGLDDNLKMSNDAWEGKSDQWGAAGDAAREASKKAEGFSGQLAILSNIGNDAMASLADGATPVVSAFTDIAKAALDCFDGMEEGHKTAVVIGGGIAALAGPVLTMGSTFITAKDNVKKFASESSAMGRALSIAKDGFANAGTGAEGMKNKLAAVGGAAKSFGTSLLKDLAVAAVVAGIAVVVGAISDYIKKCKDAEEASKNAGDTIGAAIGGTLSEQSDAILDFTSDYDEMVATMAENNRKIRDSAKETYGKTALIEEYGEAVKKALKAYNNGDRSAESMASLKTSLDLYNDAAGTSISVSEKASGKLQLMQDDAKLTMDAFDDLTVSMKNAAKAEFFKESYSMKLGDYRTALDELAEAQDNVKNARKALDEVEADPLKYDEHTVRQYNDQLEAAEKNLENVKQKYGETTSAMNQYDEAMKLDAAAVAAGSKSAQQWVLDNDALQVSIWRNYESVTDFAEVLGQLNLDYETLSANSEVVEQMGASWDGTLGSIVPGLAQMGVKIDENTAKTLGLNAVKIGNKTYYVSDDGTIVKQNGKLAKLSKLTVGNKSYKVDDQGTIWDGVNAVGTLKKNVATLPDGKVTVTAVTDPATGKVTGWVSKTNATKATTKTDSNTSSADSKVRASVSRANASKGTIKVDGNASGAYSAIRSAVSSANSSSGTIGVGASTTSFWSSVNNIDGRTVGTAYIDVKQRGGSAVGGYSQTPWDLSGAKAPRMATGAIVTRPLLTNNGWVGEDGAEAVLNWATGGAVIPLTNRKYMEPIARAIAMNMDNGGGGGTETRNVTVYLQYDASADAAQMANDIARMLDRKLAMEG